MPPCSRSGTCSVSRQSGSGFVLQNAALAAERTGSVAVAVGNVQAPGSGVLMTGGTT